MALESHDVPIVVIDINGIVRYLNGSACVVAQINSAEDVVGKPISAANFAWRKGGVSLIDRLAQGETTTYFELDGNTYACEAAKLFDRLGHETGVVEYIRTKGSWVYNAGIDELTGISDKSRFFAETRRLLDCNPNERYVMVYWDVIRFRLINDVFSNETGDNVLRNIAQTIKSFVGEEGTCGRLVEDRFAFCVPRRCLNADWFRTHSEVTLMSDMAMYTFNSTYGVYEIDDLSCSVETMCARAEAAQSTVNEARAIEGDCYAFYDTAMHKTVVEDQELISQLSYALDTNQIKVYLQPIYDITTGKIASAEALSRWEHPEKGLIPPIRFIPLFESNGMITELDKHLWEQVASFLEQRLAAGEHVVPVSVNVSRVDFFATTLLDDLDEIVNRHRIPHELLRIEITESAYTDDPTRIQDMIAKLRKRGYTVLLDDFGSGYSSLNTVKDIPIDILKLDMSFLRDFETDERTKHVIYHIVAMAHDLNLKVVAEGVETLEQVRFLREINCHLAQGYYYARPQPEENFIELLDHEASDGA
ncbi:MAG: EAL domain-containing protein [Coriobacteriales bacterium]|nr:EAL domain-containing protein [Coriobacteriales bacterium]